MRTGAGGCYMKYPVKQVNTEILEWIRSRLESKKQGTFGIEITLREGMPISILKTDRLNYRRVESGILERTD